MAPMGPDLPSEISGEPKTVRVFRGRIPVDRDALSEPNLAEHMNAAFRNFTSARWPEIPAAGAWSAGD